MPSNMPYKAANADQGHQDLILAMHRNIAFSASCQLKVLNQNSKHLVQRTAARLIVSFINPLSQQRMRISNSGSWQSADGQ